MSMFCFHWTLVRASFICLFYSTSDIGLDFFFFFYVIIRAGCPPMTSVKWVTFVFVCVGVYVGVFGVVVLCVFSSTWCHRESSLQGLTASCFHFRVNSASKPKRWPCWWSTSSGSCQLTDKWKQDRFWMLCHTFHCSLVSEVCLLIVLW